MNCNDSCKVGAWLVANVSSILDLSNKVTNRKIIIIKEFVHISFENEFPYSSLKLAV